MNPKEKSLREILQDFALNVQLDWDADAPEEVYQKKIDNFCSAIHSHYKARQLSKREIEKIIQPYWFLALFIPFMGIGWMMKKITNTIFKAQEDKLK